VEQREDQTARRPFREPREGVILEERLHLRANDVEASILAKSGKLDLGRGRSDQDGCNMQTGQPLRAKPERGQELAGRKVTRAYRCLQSWTFRRHASLLVTVGASR
jgi:hypothetical protein